jgi:hypothetical protein
VKWPFVSRRRYDELADDYSALHADRERIRNERTQFAKDRELFKREAEKYTDACIVNECLTEELATVREQLAEAQAQFADTAVAEWSRKARAEKKRADRLQKQYADAVGLRAGRIEDSSRWQPGYQDPKKATS